MLGLVAAVAIAPWSRPPYFRPLPGWQTGRSGALVSTYGPVPGVRSPKEATAWMVKGAAYDDAPTADPPQSTLSHLPKHGIVVFAAIYQSAATGSGPIRLRLAAARHFPCCDGTAVTAGVYGLTGSGPRESYAVIVRVYFGSPPTRAMRAEAQQALDRLELPTPGPRR